MELLSQDQRKILLNESTSKHNKLWLVKGYQSEGYYVEYKWPRFRDELQFKFEPDGQWQVSKSFDTVYQAMSDGSGKPSKT